MFSFFIYFSFLTHRHEKQNYGLNAMLCQTCLEHIGKLYALYAYALNNCLFVLVEII